MNELHIEYVHIELKGHANEDETKFDPTKQVYVKGDLETIKKLVEGNTNIEDFSLLPESYDGEFDFILPKDQTKFLRRMMDRKCNYK